VPSLLYGDTTPEALAWYLANIWPSSGVLSSEAGIVFGGHAMGRDSITPNLALLNSLWDGRGHKVHRRSADPFNVAGVRLTMGLAVQPQTVRTFFENSKGLARGSGFAARFLIAWPSSMQGTRPFRSAPESWPHLSAFHRRIIALLDQGLNINERGELELPVLGLSPEAKDAWVYYHDEIESELRPGGDMEETRDVASKAPDGAVRLAALFHIFEHGVEGEISAAHMRAASRIATWHLYEARRFLSELVMPPAVNNAVRLDAWLLQHCRETHTTSATTWQIQ
jgi:putative DNA primase/helicase